MNNRREILIGIGALTSISSGCLEAKSTGAEENTTDKPQGGSPSDTSNPPSSNTPSPAEIENLSSPGKLLPPESNGWERTEVVSDEFSRLGAEESSHGYYEREGKTLEVIVMEFGSSEDAATEAEILFCQAGWSVVLSEAQFTVAASTGTPQITATPEAPPTMEGTPTKDSTDLAISLLSSSEYLPQTHIENEMLVEENCGG